MDMIKDRNLTSHTYNEQVSSEIVKSIINLYFSEFEILQTKLKNFKDEEQL